jgi:hypothetical protein
VQRAPGFPCALCSFEGLFRHNSGAKRRENADSCPLGCLKISIGNRRRVGKANGSRECAPDDRLRVPTISGNQEMVGTARWAFAHPTTRSGRRV